MDIGVLTATEILIVEDDLSILNTVAYNLTRQGFGVQKATNGTEALKLARKHRPNLILLDILLSGESGIQVCERIRDSHRGPGGCDRHGHRQGRRGGQGQRLRGWS